MTPVDSRTTTTANDAATRRRPEPTADVKRMVWARAAGRCAFCRRYLLENELTRAPGFTGELAHIVGWNATAGSPRGLDPLPEADRNKADNLLLLCKNDHTDVDRNGAVDAIAVKWLRKRKHEHESFMRQVTGIEPGRRTVVVRMVGMVQGDVPELSPETAASATLRNDARVGDFPLSHDGAGVEINLRDLPGEAEGTAEYWSVAQAQIRDMCGRVADGIAKSAFRHVSVFAVARLPLLVYLGAMLDDTFEVSVYQRLRQTQTWDWLDSPPVIFQVEGDAEVDPNAAEAVVVMNVSGTITPRELPAAVAGLPQIVLRPVTDVPSADLVATRQTLTNFEMTVRDLLSKLEATNKPLARLHMFLALPASAAVTLGRTHMPTVHPALVVYHRSPAGYVAALEIR